MDRQFLRLLRDAQTVRQFLWRFITCQPHRTSTSADKIRQIRRQNDSKQVLLSHIFHKLTHPNCTFKFKKRFYYNIYTTTVVILLSHSYKNLLCKKRGLSIVSIRYSAHRSTILRWDNGKIEYFTGHFIFYVTI